MRHVPAACLLALALASSAAQATDRHIAIDFNGPSQTGYLKMGAPENLTATQVKQLKILTADKPETTVRFKIGKSGKAHYQVKMRANDVVLVTVDPR